MNYVERDLMWKAQIESLITKRCAYETKKVLRIKMNAPLIDIEKALFEISDELENIAKEIRETTK